MIKAAEEAIGGAAGGDTKIGESANNGAAADADSVKNIAKGMKGIVDAAGTAAGKKEDVLKDVQAAAGEADAAAGKLFGTDRGGAAGGGEQNGAAPNDAKNPIAAAIGAGAGAS